MRAARDRADGAAAHAIERLEEDVVAMLGTEKFLGAPDLGGGFKGYRVGDGSVYSALPPRQPKLAISAWGLLVVATNFGDVHHVQRAPHSMRQARVLESFIEAMKAAIERHVEACASRREKFDAISARAGRILSALDS